MNISISIASGPGRRALAAVLTVAACLGLPLPSGAEVLDKPAERTPAAFKRAMTGIAVQGNTAVSVGVRGTILVSRDAGKTWKQADVPVTSDLTNVRFTGPNTAWATGHDGVVLRSSDGGQAWVRVLDGRSLLAMLDKHYRAQLAAGVPDAAAIVDEVKRAAALSATPGVLPYPFLDIRIGADGEGFVAGAFGLLLRTGDGGKTWEPWLEKAGNDRRMHLYALEQTIDGNVYLAGEQGLLRRLDRAAGRFAEVETPYTGTWFGLASNEAGLFAFGLRGNVFVSNDGAASWEPLALGTQATVVGAFACAPGELAFVTQSGQMLVHRGGKTVDARLARNGEVYGAAPAGTGQVALAGTAGARMAQVPGCGADAARMGKN
ncbi:YCF48-related protein [Massilia yuzhufengensis]|uniref:Photosynthesis system II assembly factor Ycf48/Hcf136-like domain-containing protein n=1 Tax=Massilia yuzhufengensis TaxID=1164594 RepID=A0A1I1IWA9_9BURK|nr:YCF48-related protein [Massilia yuzhufengensis]SFC40619.1 Uncharacterized protein SAMN05216204_10618 [Massilia yuzhufengensis]